MSLLISAPCVPLGVLVVPPAGGVLVSRVLDESVLVSSSGVLTALLQEARANARRMVHKSREMSFLGVFFIFLSFFDGGVLIGCPRFAVVYTILGEVVFITVWKKNRAKNFKRIW